MTAMFGASAAKVQCLLISSRDSGGPRDGKFASQGTNLPHLLKYQDFCTLLEWEMVGGDQYVGNVLNYSLQVTTNCYFYPTENPVTIIS